VLKKHPVKIIGGVCAPDLDQVKGVLTVRQLVERLGEPSAKISNILSSQKIPGSARGWKGSQLVWYMPLKSLKALEDEIDRRAVKAALPVRLRGKLYQADTDGTLIARPGFPDDGKIPEYEAEL